MIGRIKLSIDCLLRLGLATMQCLQSTPLTHMHSKNRIAHTFMPWNGNMKLGNMTCITQACLLP